MISRSFWFFGFAPAGTENHWRARRRVIAVADRLIEEAETTGDVLLCAHGYLNWMIHRVLKKRGWALSDHQGGNNYWSFRAYKRPGAVASARIDTNPSEERMAAE